MKRHPIQLFGSERFRFSTKFEIFVTWLRENLQAYRIYFFTAAQQKKDDEPPAKLLDDLFKKIKDTPCLNSLPSTEEQVNKELFALDF